MVPLVTTREEIEYVMICLNGSSHGHQGGDRVRDDVCGCEPGWTSRLQRVH